MAYMDEKIAKMLKKERLKRQAEKQLELEKELESQIDEEEVRNGIADGKCSVLDRTFTFEQFTICDGRFSIYLPSEEILIQNDEKNLFKSVNEMLGFSCTAVATDEKADFEPLHVYKKNMEHNLKRISFKWLEEGANMTCGCKIMYLDFITLTGVVNVHQNMWFIMTPHGQAQIVVNYDHAEEKYWKPIVKAIRNMLEIHR